MIRKATIEDLPIVLELAIDFADESVIYRNIFNKITFGNYLRNIIPLEHICFLVKEIEQSIVGFFVGMIISDPQTGKLAGYEIYWFISKKFRGKVNGIHLLRFFEKWVRNKGCLVLYVSHMWDSKEVGDIYKRMGYQPINIQYRKEI